MASLAALLVDRAKDLTRHIAGAIAGDVRHVHQGRVASRRLRESLPAAGRGSGKAARRAGKAFRAVTRALGPVRELDVALAHLEDGLEGARIPRVSIERVRAHVQAERERRREKMLARLERVDLDEAIGRVERVARGGEASITTFSAARLAERIRLRAGALASAIEHAGTLYHPEKLHEVRIAAKKLRYGLEVVSSTSLSDQAANIRSLKRVQELLGVMHDYQILLEHVSAVREATPKGSPGAAGLKSMAAAYDRECRRGSPPRPGGWAI
jgi:CHAD domain-containing protein